MRMHRLMKSASFFTVNDKVEKKSEHTEEVASSYVKRQQSSDGLFKKMRFFRSASTPAVLNSLPMCREMRANKFADSEISEFPLEDEELFFSSDSSSEDEQLNEGHINVVFECDDEPAPEIYARYGEQERGTRSLGDATDIKYIGNGKCLVTDMICSRLCTFSKRGRKKILLCHDQIKEPCVSAITNDGKIVVTSRKSKSVSIFSPNGQFEFSFGERFFQRPCGIAIDKLERFIVTDIVSNEVSVHDNSGSFLFYVGDSRSPLQQFNCPRYVHVTDTNDIVVADTSNHCIKFFNAKGHFIRKVGSFGREDGKFKSPYSITSDKQGILLVADHYNDRICLFTKDGEYIRNLVTSSDGLYHPQGIALSPDMKLYITHGKMKATEVIAYTFNKQPISRTTEVIVENDESIYSY